MPLLGFTVLKEELLNCSKTQTIRLPRKRPLKVGDKLYIYWHPRQKDCEFLGEGVITKIERKAPVAFTYQDALKDGFHTDFECSAITYLCQELSRGERESPHSSEVG